MKRDRYRVYANASAPIFRSSYYVNLRCIMRNPSLLSLAIALAFYLHINTVDSNYYPFCNSIIIHNNYYGSVYQYCISLDYWGISLHACMDPECDHITAIVKWFSITITVFDSACIRGAWCTLATVTMQQEIITSCIQTCMGSRKVKTRIKRYIPGSVS